MNHPFPDATTDQVDSALRAAETAFLVYRKLSGERRAIFLEAIANGLERDAEKIIELADRETSLGRPRLEIELQRTVDQTRLFADLSRSGRWKEPRFDEAEPDRHPLPKPAIRSYNTPLGPIVVIGACNFPLAISVVGTDTMSALAIGCPVVVKSHPGHPATCEKLGALVDEAAQAMEMPRGIFALLHGASHRVGSELVEHPLAKAVAFTGSLKGGKALAALAAARPEPIPFYAEMGSLNPLFVLPGALRERGDQIAQGYIAAFTLFAGQMCTKPGVLAAIDDSAYDDFLARVIETTVKQPPVAMLNAEIRDNFETAMKRLGEIAKLVASSEQEPDVSRNEAACQLYVSNASTFLENPSMRVEAFGPASIVLRAKNEQEFME
ncbi:MAG: aldehyde dehydrogenase family protein, partial [Opitutales bacterium]